MTLPAGIDLMKKWIMDQWLIWTTTEEGREVEVPLIWDETGEVSMFTFANEKPAAWLTIDDRALCFNGNWADPNFSVQAMQAFRPWNKP